MPASVTIALNALGLKPASKVREIEVWPGGAKVLAGAEWVVQLHATRWWAQLGDFRGE